MKKILVLALGVVLVAAACNKTPESTTPVTPEPSAQTPTPAAPASPETPKAVVAEVEITADGFSPASITVKAGTAVTFKNTDSAQHRVASDPHPSHTDLPGFDSKDGLSQNETYQFVFTKVGTWGYHDHFNPTKYHGTVVVTE